MNSVPRTKDQRPRTRFVSTQECMPAVLTRLLQQQPPSDAKVTFAWRAAVGRAVDRATTVSLRRDGTLEVRASDQHWRREIARSATLIVDRLAGLLGGEVVKRIDVIVRRSPCERQ